MLDRTPNLWYNNWVGSAGVGPQKERLEMKTLTTIKFRKATHTGISEYEVKLSGNAPLIMDGEKVTFAEVEALLMTRYPDDTRAQIHKTVGLMIASGEIKL